MGLNKINTNDIDISIATLSITDPSATTATLVADGGLPITGVLNGTEWEWDPAALVSAGYTPISSITVTFTMPDGSTQTALGGSAGVSPMRVRTAINGSPVAGIDTYLYSDSGRFGDTEYTDWTQAETLTVSNLIGSVIDAGTPAGTYELLFSLPLMYSGATVEIRRKGFAHVAQAVVDVNGDALFVWDGDTTFNNGDPLIADLEAVADVAHSIWQLVKGSQAHPWEIYILGADASERLPYYKVFFAADLNMWDRDSAGLVNPHQLLIETTGGSVQYTLNSPDITEDVADNVKGWANPADDVCDILHWKIDSTTYPALAFGVSESTHRQALEMKAGSSDLQNIKLYGTSNAATVFAHDNDSGTTLARLDPYTFFAANTNLKWHMRNKAFAIWNGDVSMYQTWQLHGCPVVLSYYDTHTAGWFHSTTSGSPAADEFTTPLLTPGGVNNISLHGSHTPQWWVVTPIRGQLSAMFYGETARFDISGGGTQSQIVDNPKDHANPNLSSWPSNAFGAWADEATVNWQGSGTMNLDMDWGNLSGLGTQLYRFNIN